MHSFLGTWWKPDIDASSVTLRIGHKYKVRIASKFDNNIKAISGTDQDYTLSGDYDVVVLLRSGKNVLGCWIYAKAVIQGGIQEISGEYNGKTTFPAYDI